MHITVRDDGAPQPRFSCSQPKSYDQPCRVVSYYCLQLLYSNVSRATESLKNTGHFAQCSCTRKCPVLHIRTADLCANC